MKVTKPSTVTIVSILGTVLSIGASLMSAWAGNKKIENQINDAVTKKLAGK